MALNVALFPGQGAQFKGMGKDLWPRYPEWADAASRILGYSIVELCLHDPDQRLRQTQYTQPAIYVVGALAYRRWQEAGAGRPDALAGHSLGEYAALHAAGSFDFETGLRLVQKRGQLMGEASGGGMAAILGLRAEAIDALLREHGLDGIDLANLNAPLQTVIAGDAASLAAAQKLLAARGARYVALNVSAAFHSRHMRAAQQAFATFLQGFELADPELPVIANATARPYPAGRVAALLAEQIASPVRWTESIRYLMGRGEFAYAEMGADPGRIGGNVLGKLVEEIRRTESPLRDDAAPLPAAVRPAPAPAVAGLSAAQRLGSRAFRERYGLTYAYVAGAMHHGTASPALVARLGRAGMLGYVGTAGLDAAQIDEALRNLRAQLHAGEPHGAGLVADHARPEAERAAAELYLRYGIRCIQASAFVQPTAALVWFRLRGLRRDAGGAVRCDHRILAKVSRLEAAAAFMSPPPPALVQALLQEGAIDAGQAAMAAQVPVSDDLCVEADARNEAGGAGVLLPAVQQLRRVLAERHRYPEPICVGLAGGIGSPVSAAAAFAAGADFILTGSINQCTVESGVADAVKELLQQADIHDMAYAPTGPGFEMGERVPVLKKQTLFPLRANRLYALYAGHAGLEELPASTRARLERSYFRRSFDEVWDEVRRELSAHGRADDVELAQAQPKLRMAHVFRWYFERAARLGSGEPDGDRANCQVRTGPALGAFNRWVRGTALEPWTRRHVDAIGVALMDAAAEHLRAVYEGMHAPA